MSFLKNYYTTRAIGRIASDTSHAKDSIAMGFYLLPFAGAILYVWDRLSESEWDQYTPQLRAKFQAAKEAKEAAAAKAATAQRFAEFGLDALSVGDALTIGAVLIALALASVAYKG